MSLKRDEFLARMALARKFHELVQGEWLEKGYRYKTEKEFPLTKDTGRGGRADVYVFVKELDDENKEANLDEKDHLAFIEIKHTFWDVKPERNIRRLISRYARQLYSYMDGSDLHGKSFEKLDKTLGIVFPQRPKTDNLAESIEEGFGEYGIQVVWRDVP